MKNRIKIGFIISFTIILLNIGITVFAQNTITKIIETKETINVNSLEQELEENGITYIYSGYEKIDTIPEKKEQVYITEEKIINSNTKEYLDLQFESTYFYEDATFKGDLKLKDYNIQEIDNGYQERIDSKYIYFNNLPSNDLEQIDKTRIIQGKVYVLINVDWSASNSLDIDETKVPIEYNGRALYQCVIRENNPKTYKVQAIYEGEVTSKNVNLNYLLTYTEVEDEEPIIEQEENHIIPILIITGGFIAIGILKLLTNKNATVYNLQKGTLVKLKAKRIKEGSVIDITDCENINGNNFVLVIKDSNYSKLNGKKVYIQLNKQRKELILLSHKTGFKF